MNETPRPIRQHVFVQHRGDDSYGCGLWETDHDWPETGLRCGYYREHHMPEPVQAQQSCS